MKEETQKLTPELVARVRALGDELNKIEGKGNGAATTIRHEADNLERILESEAQAQVGALVGTAKNGKAPTWTDVLEYLTRKPTNATELATALTNAIGEGAVYHQTAEYTYDGSLYDYFNSKHVFVSPTARVTIDSRSPQLFAWNFK